MPNFCLVQSYFCGNKICLNQGVRGIERERERDLRNGERGDGDWRERGRET